MDVTEQTFQTDVIERSKSTPVVVDFWADWCGPCKTLAPVLEQAVSARDGEIVLAKVGRRFKPVVGCRIPPSGAIPAVKAFRDGQLVSEFTGGPVSADGRVLSR